MSSDNNANPCVPSSSVLGHQPISQELQQMQDQFTQLNVSAGSLASNQAAGCYSGEMPTMEHWNLITDPRNLADKDNEEILLTLSINNVLVEFFSKMYIRDEFAYLLINIGKAFQSLYRQTRSSFVAAVFQNETFLTSSLPRYLEEFQSFEVFPCNQESLEKLSVILICFKVPSPRFARSDVAPLMRMFRTACQRAFSYKPDVLSSLLGEADKITHVMHQHFLGSLVSEVLEEEKSLPPCLGNSFRSISVFPTAEDFIELHPILRHLVVVGGYENVDHYLDVHFRLLREDYIGNFRKSLVQYASLNNDQNVDLKLPGTRMYENVTILKSEVRGGELVYLVNFDNHKFQHLNWEHSGRFTSGALVCLSLDNFENMMFATVVDRNVEELAKGQVVLKFGECLVSGFCDAYFVMLESESTFDACQNTLHALQDITENNFPLLKFILFAQNMVGWPDYLNLNTSYDIRPLYLSERGQIGTTRRSIVQVLNPRSWPLETDLGLHRLQYEALRAALTKELSIIRGPPGTGKTYVGLKIVQMLLHNSSGKKRPILFLCLRDYILDQFLKGVLLFNKSIGRIGGDCTSDHVGKYTFDKWKNLYYQSRRIPLYISVALTRREEILTERKKEIAVVSEHLNHPKDYVFCEDVLSTVMHADHLLSLKMGKRHDDMILKWLQLPERRMLSPSEEQEDIWGRRQNRKETLSLDEIKLKKNVWELSLPERKKLYLYWQDEFLKTQHAELLRLQDLFHKESQAYFEACEEEKWFVLKDLDVVGMTTGWATRHRKLLQRLGPEIVVIEEASEIVESHVVASLPSSTKQLILIGDRLARPKVHVRELAQEFHLDLSLFERMIENGIAPHQLKSQFRMPPTITSLISHVYSTIEDDCSVSEMENIRGVVKSVYFVTHHVRETPLQLTNSEINVHESRFVVELCIYLLRQGYEPSQITILTTSTAQYFALKTLVTTNKNTTCRNVEVSTVSNYRGQENDIILLSFVRSNPQGKIGILRYPGVVGTALSRARKGMFCIGDFSLFARVSEVWANINTTLLERNMIGNALVLQCENHPDLLTRVTRRKDFSSVPQGGCTLPCNYKLNCGHLCNLQCHPFDKEHQNYVCPRLCEKTCGRGHPCYKRCGDKCHPCTVYLNKVFAYCRHVVMIPCYLYDRVTNCEVKCSKLRPCGHLCRGYCFQNCNYVACPEVIVVNGQWGYPQTVPCQSIAQYVNHPANYQHT